MSEKLLRIAALVFVLTSLLLSGLSAQIGKTETPQQKIWFIARVVNTDPFMLEYVDDWYRHQESMKGSSEYGVGVDVNPQSHLESVADFEIGDIITGEFCHSWVFNCGNAVRVSELTRGVSKDEGMRLPPSVAINLKKLSDDYKIKYQKKGFLLSYKPRQDNIIQSLSIHRDGTIFLNSSDSGGIRRQLSTDELTISRARIFRKQN